MTEREIFLAVLDLPNAADRSHYLDKACLDPAQRARVQSLLSSHDNAGSFLGTPAVQPPEPNGATQELGGATPQTPKDQTVSLNGEGGDAMPDNKKTDEDDVQFLSPSTRPDSLGRLGHYEMLQVLGRGGFGIVFRAFDDMLQRVVAVKVMAPQMAATSPARRRFLREARSSAAVRHEHVVQVYEVGEQPLPYLAMEFIPGETLQQRLDRTGPLEVSEILRIGRQIAEGLAAAHACDLIHRDIKPGNILLEGGSHKAKITDFGLARAADDASISQSGIIAGTPMFMAPEQALGHHIDQCADLFSLGSVLYQMASGRPPFRAPSALAVLKRVAEETPRPIPEIIPETPDWLCGIITKLHAKDPKDRFQSAREVADLLADCEAKLKAKREVKNVLPAAAVKPVAPTASGGRKWVAAAVVLLLPVIALAVTEFAGVTHLFRQQATHDPIKQGSELMPFAIAKPESPEAQGWVKLFNGKDLTGLSTYQPDQWHVKDGLLVGTGAMAFLRIADDVQDFHLHVEAKVVVRGTAMIDFRSSTNLTAQAMLESGTADRRAGALGMYNRPNAQTIVPQSKVPLSQDGWFAMDVITVGKKVTIKVDGVTTAESTVEQLADRGDLKLSIISAGTIVQFRKIELKKLSARSLPPTFKNGIGMEFVIVPKGKSWLGGGNGKLGDKEVEIPADFYLGKYEVTQEEWEKVMGENPSHFSRKASGGPAVITGITDADLKRFPVEWVTWDQCQAFVAKLNEREKDTGWVYRLPKYAEWEYACRGGPIADQADSAFDYYFAKPTNILLPEQANFKNDNDLKRPCKVGSYEPNRLGLFDMHGNVWEWCHDEILNPIENRTRVHRGGSYRDNGEEPKAGRFFAVQPTRKASNVGLRLARVPAGTPSTEAKAPIQVVTQGPTFKNSIGMEFVIVPKGKSWLGGGDGKLGDKEVVIPADFYLGKYEVTQEEWEKVMGEHTSFFSRNGGARDRLKDIPDAELKRFPVEDVTWDQCQIFAAKLNKFEKETGWVYRLPTEAEWEYACRGGPMADKADSAFDFYLAKPTNTLSPEHANVTRYGADHKGLNRTCRVGSYAPNALGLYDMHGNVAEWCEDAVAADNAVHRARRGGGYPNPSQDGKAAFRTAGLPTRFVNTLGLRLARVPSGAPAPAVKTPPLTVAPFTDADVQRIAVLPAAEQVEEVRKELMKRNPGFDGKFEHKIEDGVVAEVRIVTDTVTDIGPIRVFNALRVLDGPGTSANDRSNGQLADLTPLEGMNLAHLTQLDLTHTKVSDAGLVYFKDCKNLANLNLGLTQVSDAGLVHFKDCKALTTIYLTGTKASSVGLAHFENCKKLTLLHLGYTQVDDVGLAHFKNCKDLTHLILGGTKVTDAGLIHFKDCKNLKQLCLDRTQVGDVGLAQLKGMPLSLLVINDTGITDLTPLQGMPLEGICLTPKNITKGLDMLRDMKSLKTIGVEWNQSWPAAEFWERYDKGEFGFAPFTDADVKRIAALPAAEQFEEVRKELIRRNPGFDGKVEHKIEDGVVRELRINSDKVTDISPIRVFNALRVLVCDGTYANGQLADLTPLKGMNLAGLTRLDLTNTKVTDAGMVCFKECKNLTELSVLRTQVGDAGLAHFKDCKALTHLYLAGTKVSDMGLAHLKDCKNLAYLNLGYTRVGDAGLAHFKDCKGLNRLYLGGTKVSDAGLAHFKDCKNLTRMFLDHTQVGDAGLAQLKGMPLRTLAIDHTGITDLSPLQGLPLEAIRLTPKNITRGLDILRDMKSLKTIGIVTSHDWPAAEFWERYDKGEFTK